MYDGEVNLVPFCVAPVVAVAIGVLVWNLGTFAEKKVFKKAIGISQIIALFLMTVVCATGIGLSMGESNPVPRLAPQSEDIIGEWSLSKDTTERLQEWYNFTVAEHHVVFRDNHTFSMINVPDFWSPLDGSISVKEHVLSGEGIWRMEQENDNWILILHFETINGSRKQNAEASFYFEGRLPPYQLIIRNMVDKENEVRFVFEKE